VKRTPRVLSTQRLYVAAQHRRLLSQAEAAIQEVFSEDEDKEIRHRLLRTLNKRHDEIAEDVAATFDADGRIP
jgi:hypothetical protein